jgi:hypothetical protein
MVEGLLICEKCGYLLDEHTSLNMSYTETYESPRVAGFYPPVIENRKFAPYTHKRMHHFRLWLKRIQGIEKVAVTKEDMELIREGLQRYHMEECPSYREVKFVLRKLRFQKFYNHIFYIMNAIHGRSLIVLSKGNEQELVELFRKVQKPFSETRGSRVNMLSYNYILFKLSEYLGWNMLAEVVPQLLSTQKIYRQDQIWKHVCESCRIPFVKTVM